MPDSRRTDSRSLAEMLDAPLLYLSSRQAGWGGLTAEAFLEPMQQQGWKPTASPYVTLILFAGGPLQLDLRYERGSQSRLVMRDGELGLRQSMDDPYEVGWKSLSSTPTRTLHLSLNRTLLLHVAAELGGSDSASVCLARHPAFQDPLLRQIGVELWRDLEQSAPMGKVYAQTAAQMLAVHLLRHYACPQIPIKELLPPLSHRQMKRVTDFIVANLPQELSLEALADQVGFSPYHFARLFRQTTGESPHQFVLRQRVERAQYLLRETDSPLAFVALDSGFANQSHFTRVFKRHLGVTPKTYRQECSITAHSCQD